MDEWLESQCRRVEAAGKELAVAVGQVNARLQHGAASQAARQSRPPESRIRQAEAACKTLHETQAEIQNALFDCEHELRELRERDVSPVELMVDGENLIRRYRFLRRRARVLDGMLAFVPAGTAHADACVEHLRRLRSGEETVSQLAGPLVVPDCGFALVAIEQLHEEELDS